MNKPPSRWFQKLLANLEEEEEEEEEQLDLPGERASFIARLRSRLTSFQNNSDLNLCNTFIKIQPTTTLVSNEMHGLDSDDEEEKGTPKLSLCD